MAPAEMMAVKGWDRGWAGEEEGEGVVGYWGAGKGTAVLKVAGRDRGRAGVELPAVAMVAMVATEWKQGTTAGERATPLDPSTLSNQGNSSPYH
jgi:hypothetical protein